MLLVIALTIYQVMMPSNSLGLGLDPDKHVADNVAVNMGIRLFAWILTSLLVYVLMYGKAGSKERPASTKTLGLALSGLNLLLWAGITFWYFTNLHGK